MTLTLIVNMLTATVVHYNMSPISANFGYRGQTSWIQSREYMSDELYRELMHKTRFAIAERALSIYVHFFYA